MFCYMLVVFAHQLDQAIYKARLVFVYNQNRWIRKYTILQIKNGCMCNGSIVNMVIYKFINGLKGGNKVDLCKVLKICNLLSQKKQKQWYMANPACSVSGKLKKGEDSITKYSQIFSKVCTSVAAGLLSIFLFP